MNSVEALHYRRMNTARRRPRQSHPRLRSERFEAVGGHREARFERADVDAVAAPAQDAHRAKPHATLVERPLRPLPMTTNDACFVLSTGRCGTQWLASALAESYPDRLAVAHEPLHARYRPREALRLAGGNDVSPALPTEVDRHMEAIEAGLATRSYLECGHPSWSTIPSLAQRFRGRVRIIHLVRHPLPTSYSWLTHQAYQPPLLPHLAEKTLLSPFDEGVRFVEYRDRWARLTPFEKCLYYWTEVNAFGLALESRLQVPWLRLRYEDLFHGDGLERLLAFLDLQPCAAVSHRRAEVIDEHHSYLAAGEDWRSIHAHPRALEIADQLGYSVEDDAVDADALDRRYVYTPAP
jgi:hypothetical protein